jgi:Basic region leucine zipper
LILAQTDKQEGFDYNGYATDGLNSLTENKDQLQNTRLHQLTPAEDTTSTTSNNYQEVSNFTNIRDLIQDDQMFRADCDPSFFESMNFEENLHNNLGLEAVEDLATSFNLESWLQEPANFKYSSELPDSLMQQDIDMEKKDPEISPPSPIPAPPSPQDTEVVDVKSENKKFDLINYIFFGDVSLDETFADLEQILSFDSPQNDELLTPVDDIECPSFAQPQVQVQEVVVIKNEPVIKSEPEPSTSAAPSPRPSTSENRQNIRSSRRRAPKRRYSSDSDYSFVTSASSFNATAKKSKKRGRPAKELITNLPTIEDFKDLPRDHASHLVLRIKNNEASRKSRMKSKSKQTAMEDQCDRLSRRQRRLKSKKNLLDTQIEVLKRWLLGQN